MTLLNPRFTFKNFVEYKGNRMAKRALETIIEDPLVFNPVFIYSEPGMGKTHLVTALTHRLREKNIKDLFLIPKEFEKNYEKIYDFKKGFLIIDNFENFSKIKSEIIEEFTNNFEILLANEVEIILSSSIPYNELKDLPFELLSRIKGGLLIEILPPDEEDIKIIIKEKLIKRGIELEERFINLISRKNYKNIREIEGDINKIFLRFISKEKIEEKDIEEITGISLPILFFSDIIPEIEKSLEKLEVVAREEEALKTALKEKIYIWEMKGFKTDRLKKLIGVKDLQILKEEYRKFISDVTKLIEYQKIYGEIGVQDIEIEKALFDPDRVLEVEKWIEEIKSSVLKKEEPIILEEAIKESEETEEIEEISTTEEKKEIEEIIEVKEEEEVFIIESDYNRDVLEEIKKQAREGKPEILLIFSQGRRGLSTHLLYAYEINKEKKKVFYHSNDISDLFFEDESKLNTIFKDYNFIVIDDAEIFFDVEDLRDKILPLIIEEKNNGKKFLIGIKKNPEEIYLPEEYKKVFESSKNVSLKKPDRKILEEILNEKIKKENLNLDENLKEEILNREFFDLKEFEDYLKETQKIIENRVKKEEIKISLKGNSANEKSNIIFDIEIIEERIFEDYP
ncbi:MAG: DnaA/Hda family protein [candidate division WOR-3 bacterium]